MKLTLFTYVEVTKYIFSVILKLLLCFHGIIGI